MATIDPHSYTDGSEPHVRAVDLSLEVDFATQRIHGVAELRLDRAATGRLTLDTRGLELASIRDGAGAPCTFELGEEDEIKGRALTVALSTDRVVLSFVTAPGAMALQWLEPAQTAGREQPFVFTQCQPTHARSIFPCQDTPSRRITYRCTLDVPEALTAVMAARADGDEAGEPGRKRFRFTMEQPIPPYLFAFAAGRLVSRDLGPRSRAHAEPELIDAAAWEFAEVDRMLTTAESLFGPYDWERFDLLLMPPSFPYGGMENPRLTFLTPTLLAGDRSLVNVVGHELAHSWTGNLVTNATMNDFWLNEGFTTFAERRILEALEGPAQLALHDALGRRGLESDLGRFPAGSPLTKLRNDLEGVDPDQVFSRVPYEKGYLFLKRIEEVIGRDAFDGLLKRYLSTFRFQSVTTEQFLSFLRQDQPGIDAALDLARWIDTPGLPDDAPRARSEILDRVEAHARATAEGTLPDEAETKGWGATEWQVYLSALPRVLPHALCTELEARFAPSRSKNAEIRVAWLIIAARSAFSPAFEAIQSALIELGRMKFLRPLYVALLAGGDETHALAVRTFEEARAGYHPVARAVIEPLIRAPRPPSEEPRT